MTTNTNYMGTNYKTLLIQRTEGTIQMQSTIGTIQIKMLENESNDALGKLENLLNLGKHEVEEAPIISS